MLNNKTILITGKLTRNSIFGFTLEIPEIDSPVLALTYETTWTATPAHDCHSIFYMANRGSLGHDFKRDIPYISTLFTDNANMNDIYTN